MQLKVLTMIGSLSSENRKSLINPTQEELAEVALAWDTEKHLKFNLPFPDLKPTIYLGMYLEAFINPKAES